jgi:hypothetical protein
MVITGGLKLKKSLWKKAFSEQRIKRKKTIVGYKYFNRGKHLEHYKKTFKRLCDEKGTEGAVDIIVTYKALLKKYKIPCIKNGVLFTTYARAIKKNNGIQKEG